jgi:hypothetical protein
MQVITLLARSFTKSHLKGPTLSIKLTDLWLKKILPFVRIVTVCQEAPAVILDLTLLTGHCLLVVNHPAATINSWRTQNHGIHMALQVTRPMPVLFATEQILRVVQPLERQPAVVATQG